MVTNENPGLAASPHSERRYESLLNAINHGVQENDCSGTITYSNRAHHEILGYQEGELIGKKIWDLLPSSSDRESLESYLGTLVEKQPAPTPYAIRNVRKDGSTVDLQIDWEYARGEDGSLAGFISVITDITEPQQLREDLIDRNRGFESLLRACRHLAETLDLETVLQESADNVTGLVGLDTAAIYLIEGDMLHLWATTPPLPPQFPEQMRIAPLADHPRIQETLRSTQPLLVHDFLEADLAPAERAVAEERDLRTLLFVPLLLEGKAVGVFIVGSIGKPAILSDLDVSLALTFSSLASLAIRNAQLYADSRDNAAELERVLADRIRMEQEKEELRTRLLQAQKMEAIGRLAGGVAHDFNNMLSVILGYAELVLGGADAAQGVRSDIREIKKAAQSSATLTRQLLAFARQQTAQPQVIDLNEVIANMLNMLQRLIGEDIEVAWSPGDGLGLVNMDPAQVDQILANLCVNARDAISGVGKITIETDNRDFDAEYCEAHPECTPGRYVMCAVTDSGRGMDEDTLVNIFEPYYSTKELGKGTGLGLATVYGIVKQNHGFINIYSEIGLGTTFRIYLAEHVEAVEPVRVTTETSAFPVGDETILLVEDEETLLRLGERMLRSLGYRVLTADSPSKALRLAQEYTEGIDLLVTDVVLPEMNGRELAERLERMVPGLKKLYVSGYTANVIADQGILHGGVALLPKPFSLRQLATKVAEVIAGEE